MKLKPYETPVFNGYSFKTGVLKEPYSLENLDLGKMTAQHSTAQHSTAQHSTAQHSTAQHSTAQHSTAQHSTAHGSFSCSLDKEALFQGAKTRFEKGPFFLFPPSPPFPKIFGAFPEFRFWESPIRFIRLVRQPGWLSNNAICLPASSGPSWGIGLARGA
ncbi:MAG: hypothetical protein LBL70_03450 [Treponema sp.]|nr:hypothetical protein [Treponema sp.]